ncbi:hypothetical protein J2Z48_001619 [Croceifilum oryzae]|uniref:Lanthionine synthetase C-like protein n=1 Tax=Croceifilum oryzae TaxID=1553429 RepID=A0AAJ1WTX5_9BACL|nr:lanthionine synthetase C family protein [Croceifilum oryzae]MDQ0417446.1 hypothetical protein [Croceifilum oryzae]
MTKTINIEQTKRLNEILMELADLLKDPENVIQTVHAEGNEIDLGSGKHFSWEDGSLADGYPSICLLLGEMDRCFPEAGWDEHGYLHLRALQESIQKTGFSSLSLWGGVLSMAMAARSLSKGGERYQHLLDQLHQYYLDCYPDMLEQSIQNLQDNVRMQEFDVIQGWSGIGRYLLLQKEHPELRKSLEEILHYLVLLSQDKEVNGQIVPGWHVPQKNQFLEKEKEEYPNGNFNCGLAHGIPGPLALLSIASFHGVEVPGQKEAIRRITDWLLQWKLIDDYGPFWTYRISLEGHQAGTVDKVQHREAWCYGSPGVARSIYLVGKALENENYKQMAIESYLATFKRPSEIWGIDSPTFCHGLLGLLQLTHRMYLDTGVDEIKEHRDRLIDQMISMYDKEAPLRYYDIIPMNEDKQYHTNAGLLGGVAGIALVFIHLIHDHDPDWDSVFLIN